MDLSPLQKLVGELLVIIAGLTSYEAPSKLPTVELMPGRTLQQRLCKRRCPVYAFYEPGGSILLDAKLDPAGNAQARSILLHELVHYVQWTHHGRGPASCAEWRQREDEAYLVQYRWLATQPPTMGGLVGRRAPLPGVFCGGQTPNKDAKSG